jgi:alginate O-acetyltransferase complex protein AlgI
MIFNSFEFLLLFLPALLIVFFLLSVNRFRIWILIGASFLFYGLSGIEHALILFLQILWVFAFIRWDKFLGNRLALFLAIIFPILSLVYYKYMGFIISNLLPFYEENGSSSFSLFENIILPAGISFFTFQTVSLAIDKYRGDIKETPKFRDLALYISFFPQLVAGPIVRFHQVSDAIHGLSSFRIKHQDMIEALGFIIFGLAAKVLIADTLNLYVEPFKGSPSELSVISALYVLFAYSFQIYFDFYGYSLIAIGLGRLFGFHLPDNFLRPYESLNPKDFWRRWHVSLSYWIRDYLYMPLGGSDRHLRNILVIFTICGLWHGADWTFIVWGLYHAVLVTGYNQFSRFWDRLPALLQKAMNFSLVSVGWVLFLFNFSEAKEFLGSLLGFTANKLDAPSLESWAFLLLSAVICFFVHFERQAKYSHSTPLVSHIYSSSLAGLLLAVILFMDRSQDFIYFRF